LGRRLRQQRHRQYLLGVRDSNTWPNVGAGCTTRPTDGANSGGMLPAGGVPTITVSFPHLASELQRQGRRTRHPTAEWQVGDLRNQSG